MSDSKVSITITNRAPGIQPPLYLAGSFSDPEWVPEPMEYTTSEDGVHTFTKTLQVEPASKIVYKFRVGEGDWWLLNEDAPTVTDNIGNRNNILEAPKATVPEEHTKFEEHVAEPAQTQPAGLNHLSSENDPQNAYASPEIVQSRLMSQVEALKYSDEIDPSRTSTPDFIKTITEVSESAALLDRATPDAGDSAMSAGQNEEQPPATLVPNAANTAAEVADSAALLDPPTPEPETRVDSTDKSKEASSEVAAEVADTAAKLDTDVVKEVPIELAAQVSDTAAVRDTVYDKEAPSEVAAQVADTAAKLDAIESEAFSGKVSPVYKTTTDVKTDVRDESLDILGFSNEQEPVPLFAHECAGLYEDDEIPSADAHGRTTSNGRLYEDERVDYDDPTLEKFPSTRDEIMSTVRKVETGLNADQVSLGRVPLSPIVHARSSPTVEARNEPRTSETSPASHGQQHLPLTSSLTAMDEPSRSTISLQSIAEDAEGGESAEENSTADPPSEYIADVVEAPNKGVDNISEIAKDSTANKVSPIFEQAEIADRLAEVAQYAERDQGGETGASTADLPVVDKKTPAAEEIVSVVDFPHAVQCNDSILEQNNDAKGAPLTGLDADEAQQTGSRDIIPLNGGAKTEKEVAEISKSMTAEASPPTHKPILESLVTVPSPSVKPSNGLLSPVSDDDEAVVVNTAKKDEKTTKSGFLTPERAATPQPKEPGSPREPASNTIDPAANSNLDSSVLEADVEPPHSEPRSPHIAVSKPEETRADEELLPAASLDEPMDKRGHVDQESETPNNEAPSRIEQPKGGDVLQVSRAHGAHEEFSEEDEISNSLEIPAPANGSQEEGSRRENEATTSATEENEAPNLKQRSVARPDPADRAGTPISITDSHKEAVKGGNWFSAFLRLIFIDFFGGFVRKLTGGGRKTLVTIAVVLGAVGYAFHYRTAQTEQQRVWH